MLFLMDNGDIFIGVIRAIMDWVPAVFTALTWVCIMVSFTYFRLYVYFVDVLSMSFFSPKGFHNNSGLIHKLLTALLFVLLILNVYWFLMLCKMGMRFVFKGKMDDLQY